MVAGSCSAFLPARLKGSFNTLILKGFCAIELFGIKAL